ncbi:uncharacterized protein BDV14DRAFT_181898 [Aspergillus stella-maris]|uniref:uncharacterized protein n=1 Tax=Aspergillus stella-maris TaxID=1810926 RepID=UPI003CCDB723
MAPQTPSSTTTIYLDQPPSCLQFCPASPNHFVAGTYLLSETKSTDENGEEQVISQKKTGSLQLWEIDEVKDELTQVSRYSIEAAVFDLQFKDRVGTSNAKSPSNIFAIATSDASVSLFTVSPESGFTCLWTTSVHEDPSIPSLYLTWLPENWLPVSTHPGNSSGFAVTFSDGFTKVFSINETNPATNGEGNETEKVTELGTYEAKQPIEIWFVATASYTTLLDTSTTEGGSAEGSLATPYLFTGNDYGSLTTRRFPDVSRTQPKSQIEGEGNDENEDAEHEIAPILSTDDKALHHTAGVTSILPLPIPLSHPLSSGSPLLLTGSYDESLRVYHAAGRGKVLGELGLGGGVWRSQFLNANEGEDGMWSFLVLASCMHGGTRVVRVFIGGSEEEVGIDVLAEFTEHASMNYASDVWTGEGEGSEMRIVSSSFYDKRVCVWRVSV